MQRIERNNTAEIRVSAGFHAQYYCARQVPQCAGHRPAGVEV